MIILRLDKIQISTKKKPDISLNIFCNKFLKDSNNGLNPAVQLIIL